MLSQALAALYGVTVGALTQAVNGTQIASRRLMAPPEKPDREIGFHVRRTAPQHRIRKVR